MKSSFIHTVVLSAAFYIVLAVMPGFSQQPGVTTIFGGNGGTEFADTEIPSGSRLVEIHIFSGNFVDAIQMTYELPDGRTLMGPRYGGQGGQESVFRLDSDEYIIGLSGRYGEYIDSLQIQTSKRTSQLFGGGRGDLEYSITVPARNQAVGFAGRAGKYLDAIGLTYMPIRARNAGQLMIYGGNGGSEFEDRDIPRGARIVEVRVRSARNIDSVQAVYILPNGSRFEGPMHGGTGGNLSVFRLDRDEFITGLSGRYGDYIDSLIIRTNKRTSQRFGGSGGTASFDLEVPARDQAIGFAGRAGKFVDAIGLATTPQNSYPSRQRRDRFHMPR